MLYFVLRNKHIHTYVYTCIHTYEYTLLQGRHGGKSAKPPPVSSVVARRTADQCMPLPSQTAVCMYVCVYVCMYVCVYVWTYVCGNNTHIPCTEKENSRTEMYTRIHKTQTFGRSNLVVLSHAKRCAFPLKFEYVSSSPARIHAHLSVRMYICCVHSFRMGSCSYVSMYMHVYMHIFFVCGCQEPFEHTCGFTGVHFFSGG
jgi:hypothetical protein